MLTCKDASHLMSQSFDRKLSLTDRLGLRLHLLICGSCHLVNRQLDFMHRFCQKIVAESNVISTLQPGLSARAQERILKELRRKQDEQSASGD